MLQLDSFDDSLRERIILKGCGFVHEPTHLKFIFGLMYTLGVNFVVKVLYLGKSMLSNWHGNCAYAEPFDPPYGCTHRYTGIYRAAGTKKNDFVGVIFSCVITG